MVVMSVKKKNRIKELCSDFLSFRLFVMMMMMERAIREHEKRGTKHSLHYGFDGWLPTASLRYQYTVKQKNNQVKYGEQR